MRALRFIGLAVFFACSFGCAGSTTSGAPGAPAPSSFDPEARSVTAAGISVDRPDGWRFAVADKSVVGDTVIVLNGPMPEKEGMASLVEISRRSLDAADQRRSREQILTAQMMEVVQMFEGFEGISKAEDVEIAGQPATRLTVKFTERTIDGEEVARFGAFYGIVREGTLWVIRCVRHPDGDDAEFDAILGSISFVG